MEEKSSFEEFSTGSEPKRGGCLTAFLIVMIILNTLVGLVYIYQAAALAEKLHIPVYIIYVMTILGLMNVVFAFLVWNWRKAGVFGFVASAMIIFLINVFIGINVVQAGFGLIGPVILIALVKPVWNYMR